MNTYKDNIQTAMTNISRDKDLIFIGYNTRFGRAAGTMNGVPESQLIETPLAENLMMSMGIGMSLEGYIPLIYFERFDFILNAIDSLVNHLDKMNIISCGEFKPVAIIRVVVGGVQKPLFTGLTHVQNYTGQITDLVSFPVHTLKDSNQIISVYNNALDRAKTHKESTLIVEYKDLYEKQ